MKKYKASKFNSRENLEMCIVADLGKTTSIKDAIIVLMPKKETKNREEKMYVCRTTVKATSLMEARRKCMQKEPDEIWISDDWKEGRVPNMTYAIGFDNGNSQEE